MYHVNVDNQIPYFVYGGKQDGSGYKGPSTVRARGWGVSDNDWESSAGCESGFIVPDPVIPEIVWGGCYTGGFTKVDYRTGHQTDREGLARIQLRRGGQGREVPHQLDLPHHHLTPRPQQGLFR